MEIPKQLKSQPRIHRVAVAVKSGARWGEEVCLGVVHHAHQNGTYDLHNVLVSTTGEVLEQIARIKPDGIIVTLSACDFATIGDRLPPDLRIVNIGPDTLCREVAVVRTDDDSLLERAVDHLFRMGYRRIAFVMQCGSTGATRREPLLRQLVTRRGGELAVYRMGAEEQENAVNSGRDLELERWVDKLPKPVGIISWYGMYASWICAACRQLSLNVPGDVGILSLVDDRSCLLSTPAISAIEVSGLRFGEAAMAVLARMLEGAPTPESPTLLPSSAVIVRNSTAAGAFDGSDIQMALAYIEENACRGITVGDVVDQTRTMSRTKFYAAFTEQVGCTPADYIRQVKIGKAKELLADSTLSVTRISGLCGFGSPAQFCRMFTLNVGEGPRQFRRQLSNAVQGRRLPR